MSVRFYLVRLVFIASFGFLSTAIAADNPAASVIKLHETLLHNMKNAAALGFEGRQKRLAPIVQDVFDLETMTRISIGASWRNIDDETRARLVGAFSDWTVANYAAQFAAYEGERFETVDNADAGRGNILVNTRLVTKSETVALNYRLRRTGEQWRVVDIYLDGAVSQLAMRRGEFAAVLGNGGVEHLITHMQTQTSKLAAGD